MFTLEIGPGLERVLALAVPGVLSALSAWFAYRSKKQSEENKQKIETVADTTESIHKTVNSAAAELAKVAMRRELEILNLNKRLIELESSKK